jgi:LysM repeat protein
MHRTFAIVCLATLAMSTGPIHAQTLRGSASSMDKQHGIAVQHDYTFLTKSGDVDRFIELGLLVSIKGNANYEIHAVSFPYARPAVRTFVERLSQQYRAACGERLVVTSLTRPTTRQPRNASEISVHPTGMAVDLRVSNRSSCRRWLESTLLSLEKTGVLEATRERYPAHYHVAIFPTQYTAYVDQLASRTTTRLASTSSAASPASATPTTATVAAAETETEQSSGPSAEAAPAPATHRVAGGESLWSIAREHGTSVDELLALNGLTSSSIKPGQTLTVASRAGDAASGAASTTMYRVSRGDTLWSIARAHDMTVSELKALNGLGTSRIKAGQTLTVSARD